MTHGQMGKAWDLLEFLVLFEGSGGRGGEPKYRALSIALRTTSGQLHATEWGQMHWVG